MNYNEIPDGEIMEYKYRNGNNIRLVPVLLRFSHFYRECVFIRMKTTKMRWARLYLALHQLNDKLMHESTVNGHVPPFLRLTTFFFARAQYVNAEQLMACILSESKLTPISLQITPEQGHSLEIPNWRDLSPVFGRDFFPTISTAARVLIGQMNYIKLVARD